MRRIVIAVVALAVLGGLGVLLVQRLAAAPAPGTLYGNVEIREVDLAFNAEGTVTKLAKREGDAVKAGELVAELDDATLRDLLSVAEAKRDAAKAQLDLLLAGTRVEDIDQARANAEVAAATLARDQGSYARLADLAKRDFASQQAFDDARMALDVSRGQVAQTRAALAEAVAGPRAEQIAAARASLREADATVALASEQLAHTRLAAPSDGIVMTRVVEPGAVVLPSSPVYAVAITGEVWVRAFTPEGLLGRVAPGTGVTLGGDGGKLWHGRIGYVSPTAEFTPKTVETPELRTQLVYRLRIRVEDPDEALRQGMPVTIHLPGA